MSLLSNRTLRLHIGARAVQGVMRTRWPSRKILARAQHEFARQPGAQEGGASNEDGDQPFMKALTAVISELVPPTLGSGVNVRVTLADCHIHFDLVSGDYSDASDRQLDSIASACVAEILGDRATGQVIRWQLQPDMRHLLISCIDNRVVDSIIQAVSLRRMSVKSVQPYFCQHWNQHAMALKNGNGVFATTGATQLIVTYARQGTITALSYCSFGNSPTQSVSDDRLADELDERVDRLIAGIGHDVDEISNYVLVASPGWEISPSSRWTVIKPTEEPA